MEVAAHEGEMSEMKTMTKMSENESESLYELPIF